MTKQFDVVDFIIRVEDGNVTHDELVEGVQEMVNTGVVWSLQGAWIRLANDLIASGEVDA